LTGRPKPAIIRSQGKGNQPSLNLSQPPLMRKIESLMNAAITAGKDFKLDNTEVLYFSGHDKSQVYLHGNLIAEIGPTYIELFDGGWQTVTTKSRLNAILSEHGVSGEGVFQKKGEWFFKSNDYGTIPFVSGMRIA
jgi:hypothetical protein